MAKHTYLECHCSNTGCPYCDGGLAYCTVCKGAEGSLPTECPGEPMGAEKEQLVYDESLDFIGGKWVTKP